MKILKRIAALVATFTMMGVLSTASFAAPAANEWASVHKQMITLLKESGEFNSRSLVTDASRLFSPRAQEMLNWKGFRFTETRPNGTRIYTLGTNAGPRGNGQRVAFCLNGDVVLMTFAGNANSGFFQQTISIEASKMLRINHIERIP